MPIILRKKTIKVPHTKIDKNILNLGLSWDAVGLYVFLKSLRNDFFTRWDVIRFSASSGDGRKKIENYFQQLINVGLLKKRPAISPEEAKKLVLKKHANLFSISLKKCEWCGRKVRVLQDHHYPIPRVKGGKKTVSICGTCHADYHYIMDNISEGYNMIVEP